MIWSAHEDTDVRKFHQGALTRKLEAGGLDAIVKSMTSPEFVMSDGRTGNVAVVAKGQHAMRNLLFVVIVGGVLAFLVALCCVMNSQVNETR